MKNIGPRIVVGLAGLTAMVMVSLLSIAMADDATLSLVQPERNTGYTLGDLLAQRVTIEQSDGSLSFTEPPALQREGSWLERIDIKANPDNTSLLIRYQIINVPTQTVAAVLPSLQLEMSDGRVIGTDEWPFSLSPQLPLEQSDPALMNFMQADEQASIPGSQAITRNIHLLTLALLGILLSGLIGWFWQKRQSVRNRPYARAHHRIRKSRKEPSEDEHQSWLALHQAFNETAGQTVSNGTLPACLQHSHWLKPLEKQIYEFYAASTERFFSTRPSNSTIDLLSFSDQLRRLEHNHYITARLATVAKNQTRSGNR